MIIRQHVYIVWVLVHVLVFFFLCRVETYVHGCFHPLRAVWELRAVRPFSHHNIGPYKRVQVHDIIGSE